MALLIYFIKWLLWTVETMYFDVVEPVFYAARRKTSVLVRPNCANEQKRDNRFLFDDDGWENEKHALNSD